MDVTFPNSEVPFSHYQTCVSAQTTFGLRVNEMIEERSVICKVISVLLQYPERDLLESLPELEDAVDEFSYSRAKDACDDFLAYLRTTPLLPLQEAYTRTFDLNPSTTLNLTFHECGDSRKRVTALADLNQFYKSSGWEISTGDLPDYLPLMLEFAYVSPEDDSSRLFDRFGSHITGLARRLRKRSSPYAGLLELLSMLSQETSKAGE